MTKKKRKNKKPKSFLVRGKIRYQVVATRSNARVSITKNYKTRKEAESKQREYMKKKPIDRWTIKNPRVKKVKVKDWMY